MISLSFVDQFDSEAWTKASNEHRNPLQTLLIAGTDAV
jgi:hypothetical protein